MSRFNSGDWVVFTYLKGADSSIEDGYLLTDYSANEESYRGEVVKVRDIVSEPLLKKTWRSPSIKGPRSRHWLPSVSLTVTSSPSMKGVWSLQLSWMTRSFKPCQCWV